MNKLICSKNISKNIQWIQYSDLEDEKIVLGYDDLMSGIEHWKNILVEQADFGPNKSLLPSMTLCDIKYVTLLYAALDLGGQLVVGDKPSSPDRAETVRCRVLAPFDAFVFDVDPRTADVKAKAVGDLYAIKQLPSSIWHTYTSANCLHNKSMWATEETVALAVTTSGTTSIPMPMRYTHAFLYDIGNRCKKIYDLKPEDRVLHLTNIHHGGTSAQFFFPSMSVCNTHYFEYKNDMKKVVRRIVEEKITKMVIPNRVILEELLEALPKLDHQLDLIIVQANQKIWIQQIKDKNVNSIISGYGSTETLGPVLVNTITKECSDTFDVLNYNKPLDDFFKIKIDGSKLSIFNHLHNINASLNDSFILDQQSNFVLSGRNDIFRVNDVVLPISELEKITTEILGKNCFLVPDSVTNKLYLLCNSDSVAVVEKNISSLRTKIRNMYHNTEIDYVEFIDIELFFDQIKFSYNSARDFFRKENNLL